MALFDAGSDRLGDYDRCSWQVLGLDNLDL